MGYLKRERNYLPWIVALEAFKTILSLLKPRANDSDVNERRVVHERFKTWVINLMMPYFCENGYNDALDATEEQKLLKERMRYYSCKKFEHQPCLRFERKRAGKYMDPLTDEEYCDEMLPKMVRQTDVNVDIALDVLERCPVQVIESADREELMAKVTSKVETVEEMERLIEWEKKHRYLPCPPGMQCYFNALKWAKRMIEQTGLKIKARENCRDMMFQSIKKVGPAEKKEGTLKKD